MRVLTMRRGRGEGGPRFAEGCSLDQLPEGEFDVVLAEDVLREFAEIGRRLEGIEDRVDLAARLAGLRTKVGA